MIESEDDNSAESGKLNAMNMNVDVEGSVFELEDYLFKAPQKRKSKKRHISKQIKRTDVQEVSHTETESDSEVSECSLTGNLPQSGFCSQVYNVEDIKHFLKVTKNGRRVKIEEFFPVSQFIEKAKTFRSENHFTDQEVYRLKKILTRLNAQSELNENSQNG